MTAAAFFPLSPVAGTAPSWAATASGAWLCDGAGRRHVDFGCAGGAVLLGHADPDVERAAATPAAGDAAEAAARFGSRSEACAIWTAHGAAALATAAAIARRATGRAAVLDVSQSADALLARVSTEDVAAVTVDPDAQPRLPAAVLRAYATAGVLVIVDETAAGPRRGPSGAAAGLGLRADLTAWGPALANGRPLGAVTGEPALLRHAAAAAPASSTSLAAAAATLCKLECEDVALHIAVRGAEVQAELERLVARAGLDARLRVGGDPSAVTLTGVGPGARGLERRLAAQLAARGVHAPGPLCLSLAHDDAEVEALLEAAAAALPMLAATPEARAA